MAESKQAEKTSTRVVGMLSALYYKQLESPLTGETIRGPAVARFGEEVDLVSSEEKRLDALGALLPKGAKSSDANRLHDARVDAYRAERGDQEALQRHYERLQNADSIVDVSFDVQNASVGELAEQIRETKPSADDTVALAQDDPKLAGKVLEAERVATDGSPRQPVEQRLQKIIDGK